MMDFYRTRGGQHFVEGTVPKLAEAMERLAKTMERANELKEIELGLKPGKDLKDVAAEFQSKKG